MFGSSNSRGFKPVPFGSTRRSKGVPRWVMVLALGLVTGAAALYYAQEKLLPLRLSFSESQELRATALSAQTAREQMSTQLSLATSQLKIAQDERKTATDKMTVALTSIEPLKKDLDLFLKAMPPDPRGNALAIRSGNFAFKNDKLGYHMLFTRDRASSATFNGFVQLVVGGSKAGRDSTIELDPMPIKIDGYQHLNGLADLPDGFTPREVTIKLVRDKNSAPLSTRVYKLL